MALGGGSVEGLQVPITGDSSELNSALDGAVGKLGDFRAAVGLAGAALAGLAAKGLAESVTAAADFEQAMANVEKVTDPTTAEEMRSELMKMAETIPLSTDRLAELAAQAGRMGAEGTEEVAAFTKTAAEMGAATVLSAEEAGTALGKLATAVGEPLGEIGKLGDAINEVSNNFATDSTEIVDAAQRSGQVLTTLGLKSEEIIGLSGAFNELSPSSRIAATRMEQIGEAMMDPKAVGVLSDALGVTANEFEHMRETAPQETMFQLLDAVDRGEVSFTELSSVMTKTAARAFRDTASEADLMREAVDTSNTAMAEGGSLAKEVATETDTAQGQFQLLKNRVNNLAIQIGDNLLPYIRDFLARITHLVDRFSAVNSATSGWAGTISLLVGLVGGLIVAGGSLVSMMGGMTAVVGTLTAGFAGVATALASVTVPMVALAGVIAGLAAAWKTDFAGIRTATMQVIGVLREELQPAIDWLRSDGVPIAMRIKEAFLDFAQTAEPYIRPLVTILKDGLILAIRATGDAAAVVIPQFIDFCRRIGEVAAPYVDLLGQAFVVVRDAVVQSVGRIREILGPFIEWLRERFSSTDSEIIQPFGEAWATVQEKVTTFATRVQEVLGPLFSWLGDRWAEVESQVLEPWRLAFINIADQAVQATARLREILGPFFSWLSEKVTVLVDTLVTYFTNLKEQLTVVWNGMIDVLTTAWNLFGDEILTVLNFYVDALMSVWTTFWDGFLTTLNAMALAMQGDWEGAWNLVKAFLEDTLNGILSFAREWGGRFLTWLSTLIGDVIQWFKDLARDLVGASIIPDMFNNILSAASEFGSNLLAWLGETIATFISDITTFAADVLQAYINLWTDVYQSAQNFGSDVLSWLSSFISDFLSGLTQWASDVVSTVTQMMADALAEITAAFSEWLSAGKELVGRIASGISSTVGELTSATSSIMDSAVSTINGFKSAFRSAGSSLGSSLASGLTSAKRKAVSAAQSVASGIRARFNSSDAEEGPLSSTVAAGEALPETLAEGIRNNVKAVERAARGVANTAKEVANPTVSPTGGRAVPMKITAGAVERAADAVKPEVAPAVEKIADEVGNTVNKASEDAAKATEQVADAVKETVGGEATRDPLSSKLNASDTVARAAEAAASASGQQTVDEGDTIIEAPVTIEGDADEHDVERGLSRALQSYNLDR